jgi:two-component system, cell cycle sensor histidine kinase and response regulator CckA
VFGKKKVSMPEDTVFELTPPELTKTDALRQSESRYRKLFDTSPVALWDEDFSAVKRHIDELRAAGIRNFETHFAEHPEAVAECAHLVRVRNVNASALKLFEAGTAQDLLGGLPPVFEEESLGQFRKQLLAISNGELLLESEVTNRTLSGRRIQCVLRWSVEPGSETSYAQVIVSLLDITKRKRTEHELDLLAHTLRSISECVCITDMADNFCYVNEAFLATYGYKEHELLGQNIALVRSPHNAPEVTREILPATLRGGWRGEVINRRKDGSDFPVYLSTSIVRDEKRNPIYLVGIARDITEDRKLQDVIYRSQHMLRLILDNIPQRVFWKDRNLRFMGCNRQFALDAGRAHPREVIGKVDFELPWREAAPKYREDDRRVMEQDAPKLRIEELQPRPDGTPLWVRTSKIPLHDRDGKVIGVLGTYEDITEQKQAEHALRKSEEKYRKSFDEDLSGVYIAGPDGKIIACNPTFARIFGFDSPTAAVGTSLASLYPAPARWDAALQLLREHNKIEHQETELRRKDGNRVFVVENIFGVFDDRGNLLEIKGYIFDDTRRKNLEEQFRQSQKIEAVGRLAGGIAHDFNNLLTCINGYAELLVSDLEVCSPQRKFAEEVRSAGERAAKLTNQLLAFSRRQFQQQEILDVNGIIRNMDHMLRRLIGEDIELTIGLDAQLGRVKADPGQIEQVIMNLVVNARDAMPNGGHLSVQTANVDLTSAFVAEHGHARTGPHIMLTVSDSGCGISPENLLHLFEPFFTTKEVGKGTGLGLSTIYGIVKQSDGFVSVASREGHGSTFAVYLPLSEEEPQPRKENHPSTARQTGSETVLLVEDEDGVRELARRLLVMFGYRVLPAHDGFKALQICSDYTDPIHLLITDVVMPGMKGPELAVKAMALRPDIRVLFMSGHGEETAMANSQLGPHASLLGKPFTSCSLPRKVREVLDAPVL